MDNWYTIEEICIILFGKEPPVNQRILKYHDSWNKEFYFKEKEIVSIKERIAELRSNPDRAPMAINARFLGEIIPIKESKKEIRPKRLASVKFIRDEL